MFISSETNYIWPNETKAWRFSENISKNAICKGYWLVFTAMEYLVYKYWQKKKTKTTVRQLTILPSLNDFVKT